MSENVTPTTVLDLKGLLCPMPVVKIAGAIKKVEVGSVIEATATDPGVMADIPAWAKSTGNEVVKMEKEGKVITFWVKRLK
jgi:tRNA 2-thiouridine synthesizing protein A